MFTDDMDEMFFWIDETETIISTPLQPDQSYLENLLEKIRVGVGKITYHFRNAPCDCKQQIRVKLLKELLAYQSQTVADTL